MAMGIINGKDRREVSTAEFADYMTERFLEAHSMGGNIHIFNKAEELLDTLIQIMFERGECKTLMFPCDVWKGMYFRATELVENGYRENRKEGIRAAVQHMIEGLRNAQPPKYVLDCN
jgi:hypothetical protein